MEKPHPFQDKLYRLAENLLSNQQPRVFTQFLIIPKISNTYIQG